MVNIFSPAADYFPLEPELVNAPAPAVRYPSVPPGLRLMRTGLQLLLAAAPDLAFQAAWRLFRTPRRLPAKDWERAVLVDACAHRIPLASGQMVVAYEWGAAAADGPTVLLVHGWEHRATFWRDFIPALRAAGYRVVALDAPAHGASGGRRTIMPEYARAIAATLLRVGPVRAIVAHSFGAAAVAALPVLTDHAPHFPRLVFLAAPGSIRAIAERFVGLLQLPPRVLERIATHIREAFGRDLDDFSIPRLWPHLAVGRALLLHDRHDEFVPFHEAELVAQSWPDLLFEPTTGLGHNRLLRDPAVIRRVVEFIEG